MYQFVEELKSSGLTVPDLVALKAKINALGVNGTYTVTKQ